MSRTPAVKKPDMPTLAALIAQEKSIPAIACVIGVDPKTMRRWLDGYGLRTTSKQGRPHRQISDEQVMDIRLLSAQGLTAYAVSRRIGAEIRTVRRVLAAAERAKAELERHPATRTKPSEFAFWCANPFGRQAVENVAECV